MPATFASVRLTAVADRGSATADTPVLRPSIIRASHQRGATLSRLRRLMADSPREGALDLVQMLTAMDRAR
jgi:hypothetical protein